LEEIDPEHPHQRKSKDDDGSILPGLLLTAGIIAAIGGVAYWFLKKRR
jgi:hypothetical protein